MLSNCLGSSNVSLCFPFSFPHILSSWTEFVFYCAFLVSLLICHKIRSYSSRLSVSLWFLLHLSPFLLLAVLLFSVGQPWQSGGLLRIKDQPVTFGCLQMVVGLTEKTITLNSQTQKKNCDRKHLWKCWIFAEYFLKIRGSKGSEQPSLFTWLFVAEIHFRACKKWWLKCDPVQQWGSKNRQISLNQVLHSQMLNLECD